jgi:hypothetical protein
MVSMSHIFTDFDADVYRWLSKLATHNMADLCASGLSIIVYHYDSVSATDVDFLTPLSSDCYFIFLAFLASFNDTILLGNYGVTAVLDIYSTASLLIPSLRTY